MRPAILYFPVLIACLGSAVHAQAAVYTLVTLDDGSEPNTNLTGINDSDMIVGNGYSDAGSLSSFVYSNSRATPFTLPNCTGPLSVSGINNSGAIPGSYEVDSSGFPFQKGVGFLLQGGTLKTFDLSAFLDTDPTGVNDLGDTVGFVAGNNPTMSGYLLKNGVQVYVPPPPPPAGALMNPFHPNVYPQGINDAGVIVGEETFYGDESFVIDGSTELVFNPPGAAVSGANDVNDIDQIVGYTWSMNPARFRRDISSPARLFRQSISLVPYRPLSRASTTRGISSATTSRQTMSGMASSGSLCPSLSRHRFQS